MGEVFRRFWPPVALGGTARSRLCADQGPDPGEKLIAFRDTSGRVGLVDAFCPHLDPLLLRSQRGRRPALRLSRLEVRLFQGICVDLPSAQEGATFKQYSHQVVSLPGSCRHGLRLHGTGRQAAALPGVRVGQAAGNAHLRQEFRWSATTCRRWRATTTPRTATSCTRRFRTCVSRSVRNYNGIRSPYRP